MTRAEQEETITQSAMLTAPERIFLMEELRNVHAQIVQASEGFDKLAWSTKPSPIQWSPAEIVEHVLLVERGLLANVQRHLSDPPATEWEREIAGKEGLLRRFLPSVGKAKASEKTSSFEGLEAEEVASSLAVTFESYAALLEGNADRPLKAIVWDHGMFGRLNAYLWLLYIPLHSERHLRQLRELLPQVR